MAGKKILVLGGTGPAGIHLLRELVYREHPCIVYARNPSKIPDDLATSPLLEIVRGELDEHDKISDVLANTSVIISILGPTITDRRISPSLYADFYTALFPLMRQNGVRRILAMSTISFIRPEDRWILTHRLIVILVWLFFNTAWKNVVSIGATFEKNPPEIDWTVYRIALIPGQPDEATWRKGRESGTVLAGAVGDKGWNLSTHRGALARWLVDAAEGKADDWIQRMPALSLQSN